ncbi:MAG: TonB C-terminal domain-containing protein [Proteobacteria bacterium]|nr:TonB C-terminal domain-containing protein [Pseudomonadota bacterium]
MIDSKNLTYVTLIEQQAGMSSQEYSNKSSIKSSQSTKTTEIKNKTIEKSNNIYKDNEKILEERLSALQAKRKIIESAKISISKSGTGISESDITKKTRGEGTSRTYLSLISSLIREKWTIPETVPKNLEAIITVKILPNGQAIIEGFEKKSGNALFDASVIRAINNATPLPSPNTEIIVGLRFKP